MQNKIRKLAEQAGFHFYDMHNVDGQDLGETVEADSWAAVDKFAELLIQGCIKSIQNESMGSGDEWESGLQIAEGAIREYFGFE